MNKRYLYPIVIALVLLGLNLIAIVCVLIVGPFDFNNLGGRSTTYAGSQLAQLYRFPAGMSEIAAAKELEAAEAKKVVDKTQVLRALRQLADLEVFNSEAEAAKKHYERVLNLTKELKLGADFDYARDLSGLGEAYGQLEDYENAKRFLKEAVSLKEKLNQDGSLDSSLALSYSLLSPYLYSDEGGEPEQAEEKLGLLKKWLVLAKKHHVREDKELADVLENLARESQYLDRCEAANRYWQELISLQEEELGKTSEVVADALVGQASSLRSCRQFQQASTALAKALDVLEKSDKPSKHVLTTCNQAVFALIEDEKGSLADVEQAAARVLKIAEKVYSPLSKEAMELRYRIAWDVDGFIFRSGRNTKPAAMNRIAEEASRADEASFDTEGRRQESTSSGRKWLDDGLSLALQKGGERSVGAIEAQAAYANYFRSYKRYKESRKFLDRALVNAGKVWSPEDARSVELLQRYAYILRDAGAYREAEQAFGRLIAIRLKKKSKNDYSGDLEQRRLTTLLEDKADALLELKDYARAEIAINELTEATIKEYGDESVEYGRCVAMMATCKQEQKNYSEAIALWERAETLYVGGVKTGDSELWTPWAESGHCYFLTQDYDQARACFDKVIASMSGRESECPKAVLRVLNDYPQLLRAKKLEGQGLNFEKKNAKLKAELTKLVG